MFFVKHISRSKLSSVIQPLTAADFIFKLNESGLSYIDDYNHVDTYQQINQDLFRLSYASYVVALADAAISDNEPDPHLFAFLKKTLDLMEEGLDYEVLTNIFEIQVLERFGIRINFHDCVFVIVSVYHLIFHITIRACCALNIIIKMTTGII